MNRKRFLALAGVFVFLFGAVGTAAALGTADYNRPNPLMDYAPQERAIYDTRYDELDDALEQFKLFRKAYEIDKKLSKRA